MRERDRRCITIFLMPDDIDKQVSAESDYGLKGMTITYESCLGNGWPLIVRVEFQVSLATRKTRANDVHHIRSCSPC